MKMVLPQRRSRTSQAALVVKSPSANAGDIRDVGSTPGLRRSSGGGNGNPLRYSCLENPMHRTWWATVHGSDMTEQLSTAKVSPAKAGQSRDGLLGGFQEQEASGLCPPQCHPNTHLHSSSRRGGIWPPPQVETGGPDSHPITPHPHSKRGGSKSLLCSGWALALTLLSKQPRSDPRGSSGPLH